MTDARYTMFIDKAYRNYCNTYPDAEKTFQYEGSNIEVRRLTHEEFINNCQTDDDFANRWGCKIEIKELSLEERVEHYCSQNWVLKHLKDSLRKQTPEQQTSVLSVANSPTKLITVIYNNKKIESYI